MWADFKLRLLYRILRAGLGCQCHQVLQPRMAPARCSAWPTLTTKKLVVNMVDTVYTSATKLGAAAACGKRWKFDWQLRSCDNRCGHGAMYKGWRTPTAWLPLEHAAPPTSGFTPKLTLLPNAPFKLQLAGHTCCEPAL